MIVHTAIIDTGDPEVGLIVAATREALIKSLAENYAEDALYDGKTPEEAIEEASEYTEFIIDERVLVGTEGDA